MNYKVWADLFAFTTLVLCILVIILEKKAILINRITLKRWWWRHFVSRPNTMEPGGFERYVEWCAIRLENEVIYNHETVEGA